MDVVRSGEGAPVAARRAALLALLLVLPAIAALTAGSGASAAQDPLRRAQYALDRIGADAAWGQSVGTGTLVAVIDSGIDAKHEDLDGRVIAGADFVDDDADPADVSGHGTRLAGIVAAATANGAGISGTAPGSRVLSLRVVDATGRFTDGDVASAIRAAVERATRLRLRPVILLGLADLGGLGPPSSIGRATEGAIAEAHRAGSTVVVAGAVVAAPSVREAVAEQSLWVGATDVEDRRVLVPGSAPDIYAPGQAIVTTDFDPDAPDSHRGYTCQDAKCAEGTADGTSYAAAHLAGVAALLQAQNLTPVQVRRRLLDTVDPVSGRGACAAESCGRVNAAKATGAVAAGTPTPAPPAVVPPFAGTPTPQPSVAASVRPGVTAEPRPAERAAAEPAQPTEDDGATAPGAVAPPSSEPRPAPPAVGVDPRRPEEPRRNVPVVATVLAAFFLALLAAASWTRERPSPDALHRSYVPTLESLRGIAVLAVVAFHVLVLAYAGGGGLSPPLWIVAAGSLGVDLFFVLSGFLLAQSWEAARSRHEHAQAALLAYVRRRVLRILPLFWVSLIVLIPLTAPELLAWSRLGDLALFATVQQFMSPGLPWELNGVTWSLTTEVQFYLLLPAVALVMRRLGPVRTVTLLLVVSVAYRIGVRGSGFPADWLPGRIDQFAVGMAVAAMVARPGGFVGRALASLRGRRIVAGALALTVVVYGAQYGTYGVDRAPWTETLVHPLVGLLLAGVLAGLVGRPAPVILQAPALRFFGLISYGLYLWHVPLLQAGNWTSGGPSAAPIVASLLVASVAVSALTYLYVERPGMMLRLRDRRARVAHDGDPPPEDDQQVQSVVVTDRP